MKIILNKDLSPLGEEGDVKDVAKGYARNFLFPRGIAVPYTDKTVKVFERRKEEIEARKQDKRKDALGVKEKLEALEMTLVMPAGANGKLYGAVTSQTIIDELSRKGFQIERKRIELPGNGFKSVGKYKITVKLYESAAAEMNIVIQGQALKSEARSAPPPRPRHRRGDGEARTEQAESASPSEAGARNSPDNPPDDNGAQE